jgi:hypothetical protein
MTPTKSPSERHLDIDELDRAIVTLSARINAASYELLVLIRRSDERAGWLQWGFANCAEWLHWRCDLSLSAAREKVRVAHALKTLPVISLSFFRGKLSYSKVRALTRVARSDNEDSLMAFALKTTAARVEERCRELRCGTVDSVTEANRAHARRSLRIHRDPLRGTLTITVELPLEAGELIDKALDKARSSPRSPGRRTISSTGQPGGETSLANLLLLCTPPSSAGARGWLLDCERLPGSLVFQAPRRNSGAALWLSSRGHAGR